MYLRDRAFVLKKEPFREQDRSYVMYGREHGLLYGVARGSSLRLAKQAGHLEPFSEIEVMIAKGRSFDKIAVARLIRRPSNLNRSLPALTVLGAFSSLIVSLTRPGISDSRIFYLLLELREACVSFSSNPSPERSRLLLAAATLKLLDILGFGPRLDPASAVATTTLLKFMRRFPLADVLRITAAPHVLISAAEFIEESLRHTPLTSPPHGPKTLYALLTSE